MKTTVRKAMTFEAAHYLPHMPTGHKCRRMHGHSYKVEIFVRGPVDGTTGIVVDYAEIKAAWEQIEDQLDHRLLNDVPGLENPTAENIARWIFERMPFQGLHQVRLQETCTAGVTYGA